MAKIVFPVSSCPGIRPQDGSGRLINCFAVKTEQGSRSPIKWIRSAGLRELAFGITDHTHFRGGIESGTTFVVALDERVYTVTESAGVFTATNQGALSGADAITVAKNNASPANIVAVCDAGTFNLFTNSAPTSFADGDLPSVNSVTAADGYFVWTTGEGEIWASDLNAVTVSSSSNEDAQMPLRRAFWHAGQLYVGGERGWKVYDNTGDSPFPFRYNKSVGIIPAGLCGTHAVAGGAGKDDGFGAGMFFVGEDSIPYRMDGYKPTPIGNEAVCRAIATAADRTLIEASVYMSGQYAFFVITSPGEWTWEYNATLGSWNEKASYLTDDWRGRQCVRAFDRWIAGDYTTGGFSSIDNTYQKEYGDPLIFHIESGDNAAFPFPIDVGGAYFDFSVGLGNAAGEDPIETDPVVMLSWSFNGGFNWGNELRRSLGQQGEGGIRVGISNCGTTRAQGVRFKVRVSDPVDCIFFGGELPEVKALAA